MKDQLATDVTDRFIGCLLGGAVGDALGAPIEFMTRREIVRRFGPSGVRDYVPVYGGIGRITDDTQMTLFTADGVIRSAVRDEHKGITTVEGVTAHAYLRWLLTQGERPDNDLVFGMEIPGWLYPLPALHARRAPGNTCLSALKAMRHLGDPARNNSKGCGGVMRVAPIGLWMAGRTTPADPELCFKVACDLAGLTHGHPTGQLSAGVMAVLVQLLASGETLGSALSTAVEILRQHPDRRETMAAVETAMSLAEDFPGMDMPTESEHVRDIKKLGEGWVAEEALAISIYCAMVAVDFEHGVCLSVNHSGDSDSTGSMTGNLLGCIWGQTGIPVRWLADLEMRDEIERVAKDLRHFVSADWNEATEPTIDADETWQRYPGY